MKERTREYLISFLVAIIIGVGSDIVALMLVFAFPRYIISGTATETFRLIGEVNGALIGFTGIIGVFLLKTLTKKSRFWAGTYLILVVIIYFVGSILFSMNGLVNIGSDFITSGFFLFPIIFLIAGILSLFYFVLRCLA